MSKRYDGKPLLRLIELYVLHAIGELPDTEHAKVTALEPTLARAYGVLGRWDAIIAKVLDLPNEMPAMISKAWHRNVEIAQRNGHSLTAQSFAEMFVDANFAGRA